MAEVRLGDIIDVEVFDDMAAQDIPELTAFAGSGVIEQNATLTTRVNESGNKATLPFWQDIDAADGIELDDLSYDSNDNAGFNQTGGEENLSNDDPSLLSTPNKIFQGEQETRKAWLNNSWSAMTLVNDLNLGDRAMDRIRARVDEYWAKRFQRRLIDMTVGVFRNNAANTGTTATDGDMIIDVSRTATVNGTDSAVAEANLFSATGFIDASFTLGDRWQDTVAIGVHSTIMSRMLKLDLIEFIPPSEGAPALPTYQGRRVIVDDGMPRFAETGTGGNAIRYVSVLYGAGVFGFAEGTHEMPTELDRIPAAGGGGGQDILYSRRKWILHPLGHTFTGDIITSPFGAYADINSPTSDELAGTAGTVAGSTTGTNGDRSLNPSRISAQAGAPRSRDLRHAANWTRTHFRKNIPLTYYVTNG